MPKQSIFYPTRPWAVDQLEHHPRMQSLMLVKPEHKEAPLKHALVDMIVMVRAGKFVNGGTINEIMASMPKRPHEIVEQMIEELVKMRVFVMDYTGAEARLIPATQVSAAESARITKKMVSYYLPVEIIEKVTATADKRFQSASAVVHMALDAFLGAA